MPLIVPPGFGLAAFVLSGPDGTQPYITTLGVDLSEAGGDFVQAANVLGNAFFTAFENAINTSLTLDRVQLYVGSDGPSGSVDSDFAPYEFNAAAAMAPTAMSVIARKVTNELGRRGRGRMFLPGSVSESGVDPNGALTSTFTEAIQGNLDTFYERLTDDPLEAGAYPPVLLHSRAPADPTPISAFVAAPLVGWIRGRIR